MTQFLLNQVDFKQTLTCKIGACDSVHILKAYCMSSKGQQREFLGTISVFRRCKEDTYYVGESDARGGVISLMTFPEFKFALLHFNRMVREYIEHCNVVFDDLDLLLNPQRL